MFETITAKNGVAYLRSDMLRARHGFATRIGGVSIEAHTSSLNLAFGRGDSEETVLENLSLFADAVGFDKESIISIPQIHSSEVLPVDRSDCGRGYFRAAMGEGDGYVTKDIGVTLGVKSADCVPILLEAEDGKGKVIAVSAVHAGWRGTIGGIVRNAVKNLVAMGASAERIRVAMGPSIGVCCFEVGKDFYQDVVSKQGAEFARRFILERNQKIFADIKAMNVRLLTDLGVKRENIDVCPECTFCLEEKYYSHRRMRGLRGTMLSVISMENKMQCHINLR